MTISRAFVRLLFVILSLIFMTAFAIGTESHPTLWTYAWGGALGLIVGGGLIGFDLLFKRFNLRSFNIAVVGLFIGYLMALALLLIFNAILDIVGPHSSPIAVEMIKIFIFLFGTYLGVMITLRASDEIYISIPFIKFTPTAKQTKDLLLDLQKGECLKIKIRRDGREKLQGVGYLEDGTMVVVNGGGDFIGEMITARVLSIKHNASGRMVFCNVAETEEHGYEEQELS